MTVDGCCWCGGTLGLLLLAGAGDASFRLPPVSFPGLQQPLPTCCRPSTLSTTKPFSPLPDAGGDIITCWWAGAFQGLSRPFSFLCAGTYKAALAHFTFREGSMAFYCACGYSFFFCPTASGMATAYTIKFPAATTAAATGPTVTLRAWLASWLRMRGAATFQLA